MVLCYMEKAITSIILLALAVRLREIEKLEKTDPQVAKLARAMAYQQSRKSLRSIL